MQIRHALTVVLAVLASAFVAAGCAASEDSDAVAVGDRKVRVATTTNFITDTVREIGGDRVEVTGLMGPGVDPHLYKASADDVGTLREADIIFYGGLELEGKMTDLLERIEERQSTVAVTRDIDRDTLLEPPAGAKEHYDPHIWFDVENWKSASRTVSRELTKKDPDHRETYERNLERYLGELDELDAYVQERMDSVPKERRVLVTSHDAFKYFGRAYGVEVLAIQGISTAAEATTSDIERVAKLIVEREVPTVFVESAVPRQTIEAVLAAAREQGHTARIGAELYADAAGDEGTREGSYIGMVRANADSIAEGLT